jgi:hypothetical protein
MGHFYNPNISKKELHWVIDTANVVSYPGTGSVVYDLNRSTNNLTITGSPTFSSTGSSSNLSFSGTGQYASKSSVVQGALIQGPITINVIFNPNSLSGTQNVISVYSGGTSGVKIGTKGTTGNIWKNSGTDLLTYQYAGIGSVMHVAYTCDGSNNSRVYINGVFQTSGTVVTDTGTADNYSVATFNSGGTELFNGKIYYASIHKSVLNDKEIASMFHALKRRWGFSGSGGTDVYQQGVGGGGGGGPE